MLRRADDARFERMELDRMAEIARKDLPAEMRKRLDAGESADDVKAWATTREAEIAEQTRRAIDGR